MKYIYILPILSFIMIVARFRCFSFLKSRQRTRLLSTRDTSIKMTLSSLSNGKITDYWLQKLSELERPAASDLISQLTNDNPLGYDPKPQLKSTKDTKKSLSKLVENVIEWKNQYPDKVILIKNGEFYEAYGIDALMVINYSGLNPMANAARAGCPLKNIQATLDGLTDVGLSAAVYEESVELSSTSTTSKMKTRSLSQIITPAYRTYTYGLCLSSDDVEYKDNKPIFAIRKTALDYMLCQIWLDEKKIIINERFNKEGIRILYDRHSCMEPIFVDRVTKSDFPTLPPFTYLTGYNDNMEFINQVLREIKNRFEVNIDHFRLFPYESIDRPRSIYTSTALQIGLLPNENVPHLMTEIMSLSTRSPAYKFLHNWISNPPPYILANSMQKLCHSLANNEYSMYIIPTVHIGKITSLLHYRQCNVPLFQDVRMNIQNVLVMLDGYFHTTNTTTTTTTSTTTNTSSINTTSSSSNGVSDKDSTEETDDLKLLSATYSQIVESLSPIVAHETGYKLTMNELYEKGKHVLEQIDAIIHTDSNDDSHTIDNNNYIPEDFFRNNENDFRGKVISTHPEMIPLYDKLQKVTKILIETVKSNFPFDDDIKYDYHDNAITVKRKKAKAPKGSSRSTSTSTSTSSMKNNTDESIDESEDMSSISTNTPIGNINDNLDTIKIQIDKITYKKARDRRGKEVADRYTTDAVESALRDYLSVVEEAPSIVQSVLQKLSETLVKDLDIIIYCCQWNIILTAISSHTKMAIQKQWTMPSLLEIPSTTETDSSSANDSSTARSSITEISPETQSTLETVYVQKTSVSEGKSKKRKKNDSINSDDISLSQSENTVSTTSKNNDVTNDISPKNGEIMHMKIQGLVPYWLHQTDTRIPNDVDMRGMFLLTAPNMSGKSTLMRSTMVIALLANCGLYVPALSAEIPRYDNYFLRTASYDVPSEGLSAYALEILDMVVILRDCTARSLVMIDELGKGTSAKDGTTIAGALLEDLDQRRCIGIFATHLHELFQLPLTLNNIVYKRMGIYEDPTTGMKSWTYKLEDGKSLDSMGLYTAKKYGIPTSILQRAEKLGYEFDRLCRSSSMVNSNSSKGIRNFSTGTTSFLVAREGQNKTSTQLESNSLINTKETQVLQDILNESNQEPSDSMTIPITSIPESIISTIKPNDTDVTEVYEDIIAKKTRKPRKNSKVKKSIDTTINAINDRSIETIMVHTTNDKSQDYLSEIQNKANIDTDTDTDSSSKVIPVTVKVVDDTHTVIDVTNESIITDNSLVSADSNDTIITDNSLVSADSNESIITSTTTIDELLSIISSDDEVSINGSIDIKPQQTVYDTNGGDSSDSPTMQTVTSTATTTTTITASNQDISNMTIVDSEPIFNHNTYLMEQDLSLIGVVSSNMPKPATRKPKKSIATKVPVPTTYSSSSSQSSSVLPEMEVVTVKSSIHDSQSSSVLPEVEVVTVKSSIHDSQSSSVLPEVEVVTVKSSIHDSQSSSVLPEVEAVTVKSSIPDTTTATTTSMIITNQTVTWDQTVTEDRTVTGDQTVTNDIKSEKDLFHNAKRSYRLEDLGDIVKQLGGTKRGGIIIDPGQSPPLSLEGCSCVYILHIKSNPDFLYVGETDTISQRLVQHYRTYKGIKVRAMVVTAPNKSSARGLETMLLGVLKRHGYAIEGGGKDESHIAFSDTFFKSTTTFPLN